MKTIYALVLSSIFFCGISQAEDQTGCVNYPKLQCKADESEMTETDPMGCAKPICYNPKAPQAQAAAPSKAPAKKKAVDSKKKTKATH